MKCNIIKILLLILLNVSIVIDCSTVFAQNYVAHVIQDDNIGEIYKVYNYNDKQCILVSGNEGFTKISKLNITDNSICALKELEVS